MIARVFALVLLSLSALLGLPWWGVVIAILNYRPGL